MKLRIAPEPELITSAAALSQFLSPKQPPTSNDSSDGERQTEGYAHHEAERHHQSYYDDESQNVGDENVGVELDGVWHDVSVQSGPPIAIRWVDKRLAEI